MVMNNTFTIVLTESFLENLPFYLIFCFLCHFFQNFLREEENMLNKLNRSEASLFLPINKQNLFLELFKVFMC